jgi:precorrin-2 methylase
LVQAFVRVTENLPSFENEAEMVSGVAAGTHVWVESENPVTLGEGVAATAESMPAMRKTSAVTAAHKRRNDTRIENLQWLGKKPNSDSASGSSREHLQTAEDRGKPDVRIL